MVRRLSTYKIILAVLVAALTAVLAGASVMAEEVTIYNTLAEYEDASGKTIRSFNEAPALQEKVATDGLPPVEERLPEEPMVLDPVDRIGEYGGTLKEAQMGRSGLDYLLDLIYEFPLTYSSDMQEIKPNVFKSWEIGDGGRVYTFHIREGIKWSDGAPFTADDFVFWYEGIALNEELYPQGVSAMKVGGEMGVMEKVDDYTIRLTFNEPYGILLEHLSRWRPVPYAPKHYLQQYHPDYTPQEQIDQMMEAEGFSDWPAFFEWHRSYWENPDTPTISAWKVVNKVSDPVHRLVRNPYYWKVDTAGNQLPYIDGVERVLVADVEALLLKVLAGDVDIMNGERLGFTENLTVLKKGEQRGGYKVVPSLGWVDNLGVVFFNYSHEDPVLRGIFRDKRFRIALSVAMNRDEINQVVFKGMYIPSQPAPPDGPPYFGELPRFHLFTEYDPQLANQLLDAMGLTWNENHTVRLRPDGKPLRIVLSADTSWVQTVPISEMYKQYWEAVGVGVTVKPLGGDFVDLQVEASDHELAVKSVNMGGRRPVIAAVRGEPVPLSGTWVINPPWGLWVNTDGEQGEEPPEGVTRLYELHKLFVAETDAAKRTAIEKEIYTIHTENLWIISAVKNPPVAYFLPITDRLKNVRQPTALELNPTQPSSWFIQE